MHNVIPTEARGTKRYMSKTYYRLLYRLDGTDQLLLWFSDEEDGVFTEAPGRVLSFATEARLLSFTDRHGLPVAEEGPILHDLDAVQRWTTDPRAETLDCRDALAAWNLFMDVASSLPVEGAAFVRADSELNLIYEKVFWGNNLPAVTPEGERYEPLWTEDEVSHLAGLLSRGFELFRRVRQDAV
jgi:hypothetical protein